MRRPPRPGGVPFGAIGTRVQDLHPGYRIQIADADTLHLLPGIEVAAAGRFSEADLAPDLRRDGLPQAFLESAARDGRLWTAVATASGRPVGFALATVVDGSAHLYELDVLPEHGRRGLGRALIRAVVEWARRQAFHGVTLTTFRHVAWNAPFYRRLGFREVPTPALTPELARQLEREAARGLTRRLAMRLDLERS